MNNYVKKDLMTMLLISVEVTPIKNDHIKKKVLKRR